MTALRSTVVATIAAFALGCANAAYLVDTGRGSGTNRALKGSQSLAARFNVGLPTFITAVEGWVGGGPGWWT